MSYPRLQGAVWNSIVVNIRGDNPYIQYARRIGEDEIIATFKLDINTGKFTLEPENKYVSFRKDKYGEEKRFLDPAVFTDKVIKELNDYWIKLNGEDK